MGTTKSNEKELTYEIICKAVYGDEAAEEVIFDYFEPYIIRLSKIPFINPQGEVCYVIDDDLYMNLKLKLHQLIINFTVS